MCIRSVKLSYYMKQKILLSFAFGSLLLLSCGLNGVDKPQDDTTTERVGGVKTNSINTETFIGLIQREDSAFLFVTADWCGGGTLNLNNVILPELHHLEKHGMVYFIAYMGDFDKMGLAVDSIHSERNEIVLYHINDVMNNAFFQKMRLRKILKSLDSDFNFEFAIPFKGVYKQGKIIYEGDPKGYANG